MLKIIIATHGHLADGIKSSLDILCGKQDNITYMNAYVDDFSLGKSIEKFMNNLNSNDEVVIFTDILGGSVNQKFIPLIEKPNIYLISGFNLAIILDIVMSTENISYEILSRKVKQSKDQMVFMNERFLQKKEDKEEPFFD